MSVKQFIKTCLNSFLNKFGYEITRTQFNYYVSLHDALNRITRRKLEINTVIDIGASDGRWSKCVRPFYPDAFYYLIEANPYHEDQLKLFKKNTPHLDYIISAAGDTSGDLYFDSEELFGGVASHTPFDKKTCIIVPATTVDQEVQRKQLRPPFLVKLDTHGFEVPILNGAEQTLQHTNLLIIETYNFDIGKESLRFWEMCSLLYSKGFRPIDMCDPLYRSFDDSFWQIDLLFIPKERKEFTSHIRVRNAMTVKINGHQNKGLIIKPARKL